VSLQAANGCTHAKKTHVWVVFTRVYKLIFTKRSANIKRLVGFLTVYSQIATTRSRDIAMVTDLWRVLGKTDTSSHNSVRWHSTTVGGIAKRMGEFHCQ